MIKQFIFVGLGGGMGSILRYAVSLLVSRYGDSALFPLPTFIANVSGCILIGFLTGLSVRYGIFDHNLRLLLITGFCGGYTTFSTFSLESIRLLETQHYLLFALYTVCSLILCIASAAAGMLLSKL
jgi:CrcB protein